MELEQGIVLKTIDYQENSKIIYLLTSKGIVSAVVRGAKNLKSHTYLALRNRFYRYYYL